MSTAIYEYKARDRSGNVHSGSMEGSSPASVAGALREKGYTALRVDAKRVSGLDREITIPGFKKKVKLKEVAIFSRQLATMVNSGLTLIRALAILEEQNENPALAGIIGEVRTNVEQGNSLSAALEQHPDVFNHLHVSMVRAGEVGGALDYRLAKIFALGVQVGYVDVSLSALEAHQRNIQWLRFGARASLSF